MVGLAINTPFGAVALDVVHSRTSLDDVGVLQGQSYRFTYSNVLEATQTNFSFNAFRYSTEDYLSLNDAISLKDSLNNYTDEHNTSRNDAYRHSYQHSKNEFQANINQPLNFNGEDYGAFYLSGSWTSYWKGRIVLLNIRWDTAIRFVPYPGIFPCNVTITNGGMKTTACILASVSLLAAVRVTNLQFSIP